MSTPMGNLFGRSGGSTGGQGVTAPGASGVSVASYEDYARAQRAVDHLSDENFPVENVKIVGTELRMVEQVYGRLTWNRVAISGIGTGAWIGLLVGLVLSIVVDGGAGGILWGVLNGAVFGLIFALVSYAMTRGRRDFVSRSAILPARYDVIVEASHAERARALISRLAA